MSVLVVMEQSGGAWHRMSWETLAGGQKLGAALNVPVTAAVIGADVGGLADELASKNVAQVFALESPALAQYTPDAYTAALEQLLRNKQPEWVLFPHTYQVRDFAPKLATRLGQVLVSDVIEIRVEGDSPICVRQLFQGKLNADVRSGGSPPHFASLQAGAFRADAVQSNTAKAPIENITVQIDPAAVRTRGDEPFRESQRTVDLGSAELIVSVGRGIGEKDNIGLVEELASALGAELAASRPICDNGWLPMERQVGSSGQTVSPKLYMAVGISGAIQHLVGMKGAKTVVAINKDPNAPIFEIADYGIIGDLFEIVPALTEELRKAKS
jgi:electron transfer flavoprotein alpha subunit